MLVESLSIFMTFTNFWTSICGAKFLQMIRCERNNEEFE